MIMKKFAAHISMFTPKHYFTLALTALAFIGSVSAGEITVQGNYYGKNIFVQNPYAGGAGFCITEVNVNGKVTTDEIQQSSFEIDLAALQLVTGQKVEIKIKHKDDCKTKPKVVNPEDLKPRSSFEIVPGSMKVGKDGKFSFTTKGETGKLTFVVEHYRWNKWVKVAEIEGKGTPDQHYYEIKYVPFSGENKIRVKQVDVTGPRLSDPIKYRSLSPVITFKQEKDQSITFSADTKWEVFDTFGNVVLQGFGSTIDVSSLKKGTFYVNYDNKTGDKFTKK
jgi:hypothetical protein